MGRLTTHVLDTAAGTPAAGMRIDLVAAGSNGAQAIRTVHTNAEGRTDEPGVYHFSNEGVASWYDFAYFLVRESNLPCRVQPISTAQYKTAAVRPKFSLLDKSKIKATFAVQIPHWTDSLRICIIRSKVSWGQFAMAMLIRDEQQTQ